VLKKARRGHGRGLFEESEMDAGMNIFEILQMFRESHSQRQGPGGPSGERDQ